jgi:ATP-dependent Clp protease ATP-binding subunit ClpB
MRHISISLTEGASALLAKLGYDPAYGARPLKRVIQKHLENPLSMAILKSEVREGMQVEVDEVDGKLVFHPV